MVAVAISESTAPEAPHLLHLPVTKQGIVSKEVNQDQTVSLIAGALSMVKGVSPAEPIRNAVGPQSLQQPPRPPGEGPATPSQGAIAEELTAEGRLAMQRAAMRERVEMFKATQERFKRERDYAATMAKVRAATASVAMSSASRFGGPTRPDHKGVSVVNCELQSHSMLTPMYENPTFVETDARSGCGRMHSWVGIWWAATHFRRHLDRRGEQWPLRKKSLRKSCRARISAPMI
jgi:hypothetical protein